MDRNYRTVLYLIVIFLWLWLLFLQYSTAVPAEKRKLRIYTGNVEVAVPLFEAFEKAYPDIQIVYDSRAKGNEMRNIIRFELTHQKQTFDILFHNLNTDLRNLITEFKGNGLIPFQPKNAAGHALDDPKKYWTAIFSTRYVLGYNTKLIKEPPPNFDDLIMGKYEFMLDPQDFGWFEGLTQCLGEDEAKYFLQKLASQKPLMRKGHTLKAMLVIAGEAPTATMLDTTVLGFQKKGAPLAWNPDLQPLIARTAVMALAKGPNEKDAKQFIEFTLSTWGQAVIEATGAMPVRLSEQKKKQWQNTCFLKPMDVSAEKWKALYDTYRRIFSIK
ncbi:MAG: hypothetical protein UX07_C0035G0006 [Parcubacteria group bacterium GW2011_GWA2_45_30]|nr:MAG: hypothetical protein UX07_C0035G0006 [Parcubacteria group bacterium GW2011_GWA2_45_30]